MKDLIKGEIPFVRLILPLLAGIYTVLYFPAVGSFSLFFSAGIILTGILFAICIGYYKRLGIYRHRWIPGLMLHVLIYGIGLVLTIRNSGSWDADHFSKYEFEVLLVKIGNEPVKTKSTARFEASVGKGYRSGKFYTVSGKIQVSLLIDSMRTTAFEFGDLLILPAEYSKIESSRNPFEFDYSKVLANRSVFHQAFLEERRVQLLRKGKGNFIIDQSLKLRKYLVEKYNKYISNKDAASLLSALILGYRSDLDRDLINAYSKTGTMHVLSVSGMHVGIVFLVLIFLLKFMERTSAWRLFRAFLIISLIWGYALLTGFSSAVLRAAVMLSFVVIGKATNRQVNNYNILTLSAFLLLVFNPNFLADAGFQLSYLAVFGLIYIYPKFYNLLFFKNYLAEKLWGSLAISAAAQLATFPLSLYYFHQFPLYFLLSNVFILVPVSLIMYAGLLFLFIPWHSVLIPFGWILAKLILFMNKGLFMIENLPYSSIDNLWFNRVECALLYLLIISLINAFVYRSRRMIFLSFVLWLLICTSGMIKQAKQLDQKQIIFFSLRRNTAIGFIDSGNGYVFSDISPSDKSFSFSVQPSFSSAGISKITTILTGESFESSPLFVEGSFLKFADMRILVWDKSYNYREFLNPIFTDIVVLRNNPNVTVEMLSEQVTFKLLIFDNTNSDTKIEHWKKQAASLNVKYYALKKNQALIIRL